MHNRGRKVEFQRRNPNISKCLSCVQIWTFIKINFYWSIVVYDVVLVSAAQQSGSVIHIRISTLFQIFFPYRSLQSIE